MSRWAWRSFAVVVMGIVGALDGVVRLVKRAAE